MTTLISIHRHAVSSLKGTKIVLEPLAEKHMTDTYIAWLNDPVVCQDNQHGDGSYNEEKAKKYLASVKDSTSAYVFAILTQPELRHVGNVSLSAVSQKNRSAQIAILIGDRSVWGKGLGFEACRIIMDLGFNTLKLHRIYMGMTTRNTAMINICEKLGMQKEGIFQEALYKKGQYLDIVQYARIQSQSRG